MASNRRSRRKGKEGNIESCKVDKLSLELIDATKKAQPKRMADILLKIKKGKPSHANHLLCGINGRDEKGRSALHFASGVPTSLCIRILLEGGANPNIHDLQGYTPLHMAAGYGRSNNVELLLAYGANPVAKDRKGMTPRILAMDLNKTGSLSRDGDKPSPPISQETKLDDAISLLTSAERKSQHSVNSDNQEASELVDMCSKDMSTGFHELAMAGDIEGLAEALKNIQDAHETTQTRVLADAVSAACRGSHKGVIQLLLERGAVTETRDSNNLTPLLVAADNGSLECMQLLLAHGANIDVQDSVGVTPLIAAAYNGHVSCLEALLSAGANLKLKSNGGVDAIIAAAEGCHPDCINLLIMSGANPLTSCTVEGLTPLMHSAAQNCSASCTALLESPSVDSVGARILSSSAQIHKQDKEGRTALYHAAQRDAHVVVKLLCEKGADITVRCKRGKNAMDVAPAGSASLSILEEYFLALETESLRKQQEVLLLFAEEELQANLTVAAAKKEKQKKKKRKPPAAQAGKQKVSEEEPAKTTVHNNSMKLPESNENFTTQSEIQEAGFTLVQGKSESKTSHRKAEQRAPKIQEEIKREKKQRDRIMKLFSEPVSGEEWGASRGAISPQICSEAARNDERREEKEHVGILSWAQVVSNAETQKQSKLSSEEPTFQRNELQQGREDSDEKTGGGEIERGDLMEERLQALDLELDRVRAELAAEKSKVQCLAERVSGCEGRLAEEMNGKADMKAKFEEMCVKMADLSVAVSSWRQPAQTPPVQDSPSPFRQPWLQESANSESASVDRFNWSNRSGQHQIQHNPNQIPSSCDCFGDLGKSLVGCLANHVLPKPQSPGNFLQPFQFPEGPAPLGYGRSLGRNFQRLPVHDEDSQNSVFGSFKRNESVPDFRAVESAFSGDFLPAEVSGRQFGFGGGLGMPRSASEGCLNSFGDSNLNSNWSFPGISSPLQGRSPFHLL